MRNGAGKIARLLKGGLRILIIARNTVRGKRRYSELQKLAGKIARH